MPNGRNDGQWDGSWDEQWDNHVPPTAAARAAAQARAVEAREEHAAAQRRKRRRAVVAATVLTGAVVAATVVLWPSSGTKHRTSDTAATVPSSASPSTPGALSGAAVPGQADVPSSALPQTPAARPLAGKTVVLDPGHNPGNGAYPSEINKLVDAGGFQKACDTTGTETNAGYTEADFTLDVAHRVRDLLQAEGANVVFTWTDEPWGPCVDVRAQRGNDAHADAAISIHGDGGPSSGRGFHVIVPTLVKAGTTDTSAIVGPSRTLGVSVEHDFATDTGTNPSNYVDNNNGIVARGDLGGLNLSTVPKVFIECGNMRNSSDAALMTDPTWRQKAAQGIADGIADYLTKGS